MEPEGRVRVAANAGSSLMAVETTEGADDAVITLSKSADVEKKAGSDVRTAEPTGREDDGGSAQQNGRATATALPPARCWNEMRIRHGAEGLALSEIARETDGEETGAVGNVQLTTDSELIMALVNAGGNEVSPQWTTYSGVELNDDTVAALGSTHSVRRIVKQTKNQVKLQRVQQAQQRQNTRMTQDGAVEVAVAELDAHTRN
ncbi:unnamed protein product [Phytophthora fragariaefolia]|uniref:Unnamed protein product n=1 Tax=Phytophthora fragariaefolia TaxID=1490495 RepID=A0A9W6YFR3_9STRA|nr:unnamed protein product [Phytophthora fragariaefolia]